MADLSRLGEFTDSAYVGNGTGDNHVKSLRGMTEESVKAQLSSSVHEQFDFAGGVFDKLIETIGKILGGALELGIGALKFIADGVISIGQSLSKAVLGLLPNTDPFSPVQDAFHDEQHGLVGRLDLLDGVRGYANCFMGRNVNAEWGSSNWRNLIFDEPLGPSKGAHCDPEKGGIVFESTGLWTVYIRITGRATNYTGGGGVRMDVTTKRPDGSDYSQTIVEGTSLRDTGLIMNTRGRVTLQATFPIVIAEPGSYVTVRSYTEAWRWWDGGTRWSHMSVVKHSDNDENPGRDIVPDEEGP